MIKIKHVIGNDSMSIQQLEKENAKLKIRDLKVDCWKSVAEIFNDIKTESSITHEGEHQETTMLFDTGHPLGLMMMVEQHLG